MEDVYPEWRDAEPGLAEVSARQLGEQGVRKQGADTWS
jgi:hypothetical protein